MPQRIQRKRTRGWRMPSNAVYVGRPSKWGNPFKLGHYYLKGDADPNYRGPLKMTFVGTTKEYADSRFTLLTTAEQVFEWFEWYMAVTKRNVAELRGKDLACWCKLDAPCHADILLKLANS